MPLVLILILLPIIYLFSWIVAPFLYVGGRVMFFVEGVSAHMGSGFRYAVIIGLVMLIAASLKSWKIFWYVLVPVLAVMVYIGAW